jgi:hypothetical protein
MALTDSRTHCLSHSLTLALTACLTASAPFQTTMDRGVPIVALSNSEAVPERDLPPPCKLISTSLETILPFCVEASVVAFASHQFNSLFHNRYCGLIFQYVLAGELR